MKKRSLAVLLILVMVVSLVAACGSSEIDQEEGVIGDQLEQNGDLDPEDEDSDLEDEGLDEDLKDEDSDQEVSEKEDDRDKPVENKPETKPDKDKPETNKPETNKPEVNKPDKDKPETNKPETNGKLEGSLEEIIGKIYKTTQVDEKIAVDTSQLDLSNPDFVKYNLGLDDVSDIKEAVVSEALMTTQAYSLVLARVKDGANVEEVAKAIKKGIDPQKWICVMADDTKTVVYGDIVMLIMVNTNIDEVATSKSLTSALNEIAGFKGKEI